MSDTILLQRITSNSKGTYGVICIGVKKDYQPITVSYELPDNQNKDRVSCIPSGEYPFTAEKHKLAGKAKYVLRLENVPSRDGVLVHIGNGIKDTLGCIIVGEQFEQYLGSDGVLQSSVALIQILSFLDRDIITKKKKGLLIIKEALYKGI